MSSLYQLELHVLGSRSREQLTSLKHALELKLQDANARISEGSRLDQIDTLGPIEIVTVLIAAGSLLLDVIQAISEWLRARKRERGESSVVRMGIGNVVIDVREKTDAG